MKSEIVKGKLLSIDERTTHLKSFIGDTVDFITTQIYGPQFVQIHKGLSFNSFYFIIFQSDFLQRPQIDKCVLRNVSNTVKGERNDFQMVV